MRFDVTIDLAFEQGREPRRHSPEPETAVYRIVQEALTNATKHGAAARATVEVLEGDHDVRVTVRDDGSGFDPTAAASGFGLAGMRERTELLKGEISVESAPGEGTTVRVVLPVTRRPAPESRRLTVRGG
jgi:signal transduction histidine kinase